MSLLRARITRAIAVVSLTALIAVPAWPTAPAVADEVDATIDAASSSLVVATFNVRCANCSKSPANSREKRWETRAPVIVGQILGENVDVIGVQEASPGLLDDRKTAQFEDLVNRLGGSYAVTEPSRYNCTKSTTFTRCNYENQGASQDARIIYKSSRLQKERSGSLHLDGRAIGNGSARYMAWAQFQIIGTSKHFIFATAHFEPGVSKGKTATRVKQVRKAIAELNKVDNGLPVIWGSDLASSKLTHVGNKAYDAFRSGGFTDPLGNTYKSKVIPASAQLTASTATHEEYFTLNNFASGPKDYVGRGYKLGAHLDYILTRGNVGTSSWEEVMNLDSSGNFAGVIPSDHNMVRATVVLH